MPRKCFEKKGAWTPEEDDQLLEIISDMEEKGQHVKWCLVSKRFPSRSPKQCRERYVYNLDPNICKEPWAKEEDALLIYAQKMLGNSWARISTLLHGRTENSTKTRFKSIQRAERRLWKKSEDAKLLEMQDKLGCKWLEIAKYLPGRTKNAVKTRYRYLKGEVIEEDEEEMQHRPGSPGQALFITDSESDKIAELYERRLIEVEQLPVDASSPSSSSSSSTTTTTKFAPIAPASAMETSVISERALAPAPMAHSRVQPLRRVSSEVRFDLKTSGRKASIASMSSSSNYPETPKNLIRKRTSFDMEDDAPRAGMLSPTQSSKKMKVASKVEEKTALSTEESNALFLSQVVASVNPSEILDVFTFDDAAVANVFALPASASIGNSSNNNTMLLSSRRSTLFGNAEFAEACAQVASNWNVPAHFMFDEAFPIAAVPVGGAVSLMGDLV